MRSIATSGFAAVLLAATMGSATASKPSVSLGTSLGGADATADVRAWHDAHHRSCPFERVLGKSQVPGEHAGTTDERWTIEACKGARYDYRVAMRGMGQGGVAVHVSDFVAEQIADVPATRGEATQPDNAPEDVVGSLDAVQVDAFAAAIAPYVAQARATWPDAKARWRVGLPEGHIFFVTTKLYEGAQWEQVFVRVDDIDGATIHGRIANDLDLLRGFRRGDPVDVGEADLMDWTILRPDGTEEGNVVGKFLDAYNAGG